MEQVWVTYHEKIPVLKNAFLLFFCILFVKTFQRKIEMYRAGGGGQDSRTKAPPPAALRFCTNLLSPEMGARCL